MTWAPDSSRLRAQRMLDCSSKRAISSTSTVTCLPFSAARARACTIGRVAARAVERLLDGQHVGVVGGRGHEGHHGIERLVGMVQQDVALVAGRAKMSAAARAAPAIVHAASAAARAGARARAARRAAAGRACRAGRARGRRPAASTSQPLGPACSSSVVADAGLHLQAHHLAAPPLAQLLLDRLQVVARRPRRRAPARRRARCGRRRDSSTVWPGKSAASSARMISSSRT